MKQTDILTSVNHINGWELAVYEFKNFTLFHVSNLSVLNLLIVSAHVSGVSVVPAPVTKRSAASVGVFRGPADGERQLSDRGRSESSGGRSCSRRQTLQHMTDFLSVLGC